jgi:hypothetical protein
VRREYSTTFLLIALLTALEIVGHSIVEGLFVFETLWIVLFSAAAVFYATVWIVKHSTNWLQVSDR